MSPTIRQTRRLTVALFAIAATTSATMVASADMNNDCYDELAIGRNRPYDGDRFFVWNLNASSPSYALGGPDSDWQWGPGNYTTTVAVGDFTGDGRHEVAFGRNGPAGEDRLYVVEQLENGGFLGTFSLGSDASASPWGYGVGVTSVAFGNFDEDAEDELAIGLACRIERPLPEEDDFCLDAHNRVYVWDRRVVDGQASFQPIFALGGAPGGVSVGYWANRTYPTDLAFGDLDGDGIDELAIGRYIDPDEDRDRVSIWKYGGNDDYTQIFSAGASGSWQEWPLGPVATAVAFGDFDGDGREEMAVGRDGPDGGNRAYVWDWSDADGSGDASVDDDYEVIFNAGAPIGTYSSLVDWGPGTHPVDLDFGDFDGLGGEDLAIARSGPDHYQRVQVWSYIAPNAAEAFFGLGAPVGPNSAQYWGAVIGARAVAFGDLDGDGEAELAVGRDGPNDGNRVSVWDRTTDAATGALTFTEQFTLGAGAPDVQGSAWGDETFPTALALGNGPTCARPPATFVPRVCADWLASFADDDLGEDYVGSERPINEPPSVPSAAVPLSYPASFVDVRLTVVNGDSEYTWEGTLDRDGCVPEAKLAEGMPIQAWAAVPYPNGRFIVRLEQQSSMQLPDSEIAFDVLDVGAEDPVQHLPERACLCTVFSSTGEQPTVTPDGVGCRPPGEPPPVCEIISDAVAGTLRRQGSWLVPPRSIFLGNSEQGAATRVSAVVSRMLQAEALALEDATGRGFGIVPFVDPTTSAVGPYQVWADFGCRDGKSTSCTLGDGSRVGIGGVPVPGRGTDWIANRWKYIIAHELGHYVQSAAMGFTSSSYEFSVNGNLVPDHPWAPDVCACSHVADINERGHCLQSLEPAEGGQGEGYAQVVAAKTWNVPFEAATDPRAGDCEFVYYKEFLDDECRPGTDEAAGSCYQWPPDPRLWVSSPPFAVDCRNPVRWRNSECLSQTALSTDAVAHMAMELDWMGFFWNLNTVGQATTTINELHDIYQVACGDPGPPAKCDPVDDRVAWEPCAPCDDPAPCADPVQCPAVGAPGCPLCCSCAADTGSLREAAEGYFATMTPAEGEAKRRQFLLAGDSFGVSTSTTPLP